MLGLTLFTRLWMRVRPNRGQCWVWTGGTNDKGYGYLKVDGKQTLTHRLLWEALNGPVEPDKVLDHICRNRPCLNPNHLRVVSNKENILAGVGPTAQNSRKEVCIRGHNLSEAKIYVRPGGRSERRCLQCRRDRTQEQRVAHLQDAPPAALCSSI